MKKERGVDRGNTPVFIGSLKQVSAWCLVPVARGGEELCRSLCLCALFVFTLPVHSNCIVVQVGRILMDGYDDEQNNETFNFHDDIALTLVQVCAHLWIAGSPNQ